MGRAVPAVPAEVRVAVAGMGGTVRCAPAPVPFMARDSGRCGSSAKPLCPCPYQRSGPDHRGLDRLHLEPYICSLKTYSTDAGNLSTNFLPTPLAAPQA